LTAASFRAPRHGGYVSLPAKTEFNGIGGVANLHQMRADGRHLKNGRSNARGGYLYRRCRRSNCRCSGVFTLGAKGTQMTPPTRGSEVNATERSC
jgi:hypothetical protein